MIAILSDIHANLTALEAVLEDMRELEVAAALCLGDTVGYGPDAAACVRIVRERCVASLLGNHEVMLLEWEQLGQGVFDEVVTAPLRLAREQLAAEDLAWIGELPIGIDLDAFEVVHASLHEPPRFHYIDSVGGAEQCFRKQKRPVSFHGHTHFPVAWEESETGRVSGFLLEERAQRLDAERRYAINVGSVGQPRDGDPRASYVLYDHATGVLVHRRVPYDIQKARRRFRKAGLPEFNGRRLAEGR